MNGIYPLFIKKPFS